MSILWLLACGEIDSEPTVESVSEVLSEEVIEREVDQGNLLVRTQVSPKQVRLGDPFTLDLHVYAQEDVVVEMPPFGEALGRLSIVDYKPREVVYADDRFVGMHHRQTYELQANRSGTLQIPSLRIAYKNAESDWEELLTEEIPVTVDGILAGDADLVFKSARPKMPQLSKPVDWWPWVIAGLGLVVGSMLFIRMRHNGAIFEQQSPFEEAHAQLLTLKAELSPDTEMTRWYALLSQMLRRLLERQFDISALEQTTQEIRLSLSCLTGRTAHQLNESIRKDMLDILIRCDGVKFAGQSIQMDQAESDWTMASQWVHSVQVHLETFRDGEAND